jgi:hypothetical protein
MAVDENNDMSLDKITGIRGDKDPSKSFTTITPKKTPYERQLARTNSDLLAAYKYPVKKRNIR